MGSGLALSKSAPSAFEPGIYMQDMSHQSRLQYFAIIYDADGQYTEVSALDYNGNGRIDHRSEYSRSFSSAWFVEENRRQRSISKALLRASL